MKTKIFILLFLAGCGEAQLDNHINHTNNNLDPVNTKQVDKNSSTDNTATNNTIDHSSNSIHSSTGMNAEITTSQGTIIVALEFKKTPMTVANFIGLAEGTIKNNFKELGRPFYDGTIFHRVIDNFMIQGGDPQGTGRGGPGYKFQDEFHPDLKHSGPGILSMANSGPGTNGSQFFITHKDTPWLDGKHSVFGKVTSGQDIVDLIKQNDTIQSIKIIRYTDDAKKFNALKIFNQKMEYYKKLEMEKMEKQKKEMEKISTGASTTDSGLKYIINKEGDGPKPTKGQNVSVHYTGYLVDGTKFDSSSDRNQPLDFPIGVGRVIKGWDEGIMLLKVGSKAKLIIPPELGYGSRGAGGIIPPNAILIFDVELIAVSD